MTTIKAIFETRREAELAIEHLVQEHDIDRDDIVVGPEGEDNSAGLEGNGSDNDAVLEEATDDEAALNGSIAVVVTLDDEDEGDTVQEVLVEFGGTDVTNDG